MQFWQVTKMILVTAKSEKLEPKWSRCLWELMKRKAIKELLIDSYFKKYDEEPVQYYKWMSP